MNRSNFEERLPFTKYGEIMDAIEAFTVIDNHLVKDAYYLFEALCGIAMGMFPDE